MNDQQSENIDGLTENSSITDVLFYARENFPKFNFFLRSDNNVDELVLEYLYQDETEARAAFTTLTDLRDKLPIHYVVDLVQIGMEDDEAD